MYLNRKWVEGEGSVNITSSFFFLEMKTEHFLFDISTKYLQAFYHLYHSLLTQVLTCFPFPIT